MTPTGPVGLRDGALRAVVSRRGASLPWLQLCILDMGDPRLVRTALAVEPMTCPPDAFRSGVDVVTLAPRQTHDLWLELAPTDGG